MTELKVGDELIVRDVHGYKRYPIKHITKSGRIECSGLMFVLNPDLTVRGPSKYHPIHSVTRVTEDAIAEMEEFELRSKLLFKLKSVYFPNVKTEQLQKIVDVIFQDEGE